MALLNLFKKKKKKITERDSVPHLGTESLSKKAVRKSVGASALSLPHISEKAGILQAQQKYVFKVIPGATKYGVKASVEEQYGVLVEKVATIRVPSKSIRVGKRMGEKQGYKKAVVTLKEGYAIETVSS